MSSDDKAAQRDPGPGDSATSTPPGPPGAAAKVRRGKKTVPNAHTPTHMPQWVIEHARRVTEEALFNPPMPPEYRERYERLNREASERETSPPTRTSTGTSAPTP